MTPISTSQRAQRKFYPSPSRPAHGPLGLWLLIGLMCVGLSFAFSCGDDKGKEETPTSQETLQEVITNPDSGNEPTPDKSSPTPETTSDEPGKPPEPPPTETPATPDQAPKDVAPDTNAPDTNHPDTSAPDTTPPQENTPDSNGPLTLKIAKAEDIVTSYLISSTDWNYFYGETVPLGRHSNTAHTSYHTAFRFSNVNIPQGAKVTSAYLAFYPHNEVDSSHRLMINIYAEKTDDSAAYDPKNYDRGRPDQRLKTTAKIDRWIVRCRDDCSDDVTSPKYEYDCPQRKKDCWNRQQIYQVPKDLKAILQEVFDQPTWKSGNAISLFLFNAATDQEGPNYQDKRTIIGFDTAQPDKVPRLIIQFQP